MPTGKRAQILVVLLFVLFFLLDLTMPLGVPVSYLYIICIALSFNISRRRPIFYATAVSTLLTAVGVGLELPFSMLPGLQNGNVALEIANRVLSILTLWIFAFFALKLKTFETSLKKAFARMKKMNRELDEFSSMAAHDLKTPIRDIIILSELCEESSGSEQKEYLSRIQSSAKSMNLLVSDLLDYARASRATDVCEIDLKEIFDEVLRDLDVQIKAKQARVVASELPKVTASRVQMKQMFQNLISNALKYSQPAVRPFVRVSSELRERDVMIYVKDNGIGLEPGAAEKIFKPFQRMSSEYQGTGLGLTICRKIAQRHGGSLTAEGVRGEGSTFIIRLPRYLVTNQP